VLKTCCVCIFVYKGCDETSVICIVINDAVRLTTWWYRKVPDCCFITASVKEDEREGQVYTYASILHQSATWHRTVNTRCFYTSAFRLRVSFYLQWMTKSSNLCASSFAWSSVNPLPEPLKCFVDSFGEHSLSQTASLELRSRVSWRWRTFKATKHQQNDRNVEKNSRTHSRRPLPNNPWAHRHRWDHLWSFPRDLNRKYDHAPPILFPDFWQMVRVCD
jgi:hypothetical protein